MKFACLIRQRRCTSFSQIAMLTVASGLMLAPAPAASPRTGPPPAPGPVNRHWDWKPHFNGVNLTFCVDPALPANLAVAARFAASNLSNAGMGWVLVDAGACGGGWNLRAIAGTVQPNIRVRGLDLGAPPPAEIGDPYQDDYAQQNTSQMPTHHVPNPQNLPGNVDPANPQSNLIPQWVKAKIAGGSPPLAYFQHGPILHPGRQIEFGEIVFNTNAGIAWDIAIGTNSYDPRRTAMHEFAHAIRMQHDNFAFGSDDDRVFPVGSRPPVPPLPPANGHIILTGGANGVLEGTTVLRGDDFLAAPVIHAGPNGIADSYRRTNVIAAPPDGAVKGRHGINPGLGFPPGSAYSYTDREQVTALASFAHFPLGKGAWAHIGATVRRFLNWLDAGGNLRFFGRNGTELPPPPQPDMHGDGLENDFFLFKNDLGGEPSHFETSLSNSMEDVAGTTTLTVFGEIGSDDPALEKDMLILLPFSPDHPELAIYANAAADIIKVSDGTDPFDDNPFFEAQLSMFHPVDMAPDQENPNFHNVGFLMVKLFGACPPVDGKKQEAAIIDPFDGPCLDWALELNDDAEALSAEFGNGVYTITQITSVAGAQNWPGVRLYRSIIAPDNYAAELDLAWTQDNDPQMMVSTHLVLRDTEGNQLAVVGLFDNSADSGPLASAVVDDSGHVLGAPLGFDGEATVRLEVVQCTPTEWRISAFVNGALLTSQVTQRQAETLEIHTLRSNDPKVPFGTISLDHLVFGEFAPCPADLNHDGNVGATDLLALLVSWGPCEECPADFNCDGSVGATDLLALLVNWGPCP